MTSIKSLKKNISKNLLRFPQEMYSDTLGSLAICGWMFSQEKPSVRTMKAKWRKVQKGDFAVGLDDKDFIQKGLDYFGMKVPEQFPIAFVQSDWNAVFAPYVEDKLLPNREDGYVIATLRKGKVYPLDLNKEG